MSALDKFGKFLVENLRDKAIEQHDMLLQGQLRGATIQGLQQHVRSLPEEQKQLLRKVVIDVIDTATHDLLFAIQDAHDRELGIEVSVDGENYQAKRRGAVTYLLIERQIHAELNQTFVRVAVRLETMEAVQHQSQWQLPFEPATQSVKIHSIVVRRGDTSFDHTRLDKMRWLQSRHSSDGA